MLRYQYARELQLQSLQKILPLSQVGQIVYDVCIDLKTPGARACGFDRPGRADMCVSGETVNKLRHPTLWRIAFLC